jgi:hypothetical protein
MPAAAAPAVDDKVLIDGTTNGVRALDASYYRNATNLNAGTIPDARFPATLPAASGVNLTALNASNLGSGTLPAARLPALSGAASLPAGGSVLVHNPIAIPLRNFLSKLQLQGNYLRRSINGANTNFTAPQVVRIATFGDSMARLKSGVYARELWDAYGYGGNWTIAADPMTFQINVSGDVIEHIGATAGSFDYTSWMTGEYRDVGVSGGAGTITTSKSGNTVVPSQLVDTIGVAYVVEPGAGTFKIQSAENGGAFADEVGYTSVSASGTKATAVITITKPRVSEWQIRIVGVSGRVKILHLGMENRTNGGVCFIDISRGSESYPDYNTATSAILNPVLSVLAPHLITCEFKESASDITSYIGTTVSNFNTAVTSGGSPSPDWLFILTSPSAGDDVPANAALQSYALTNGYAVWDGYTIGKDYATMLALGWLTVGDGTHPTQSFQEFAAAAMVQDLRFFTGPAARRSDASLSNHEGVKNRVLNPRLDVWTGGTSFTLNTSGTSTSVADFWVAQSGGGYNGSTTFSRQSFTAGEIPDHSQYYIRANQTSTTSTANVSLIAKTPSVFDYSGQSITVSFWAKAAAGFTMDSVEVIQDFGSGGSSSTQASIQQTIALTTSWKRYVINAGIPSLSGKTIGSSTGLLVKFNFGNGSSTWTVDIWGVQAEPGLVATALEFSPFGTMAYQNANNVTVTGGSVTGLSALGANNPSFTGTTVMTGNSANTQILKLVKNASQGPGVLALYSNDGTTELLRLDGNGNIGKTSGDLQINAPSGNSILMRPNGSVEVARFSGGAFQLSDAVNLVANTTTGTKVGTSTSQKLGFYNATPAVQPSGNIVAALQSLGLVGSATEWVSVPASASASGTTGQKAFDGSYLYVCVSTNTWVRTAINTW